MTKLWHLLPLIISVSLVYAATRHELLGPILGHAVRFAAWVSGFLAVLFAILYVVSSGL